MIFGIAVNFAFLMRPRPHQTHFSTQHVEELRQLVERISLDKRPCLHFSRIIFDFIQNSPGTSVALLDKLFLKRDRVFHIRIGLGDTILPQHVSKLEHLYFLPIFTDAFILVDDRAIGILNLDKERNDQHDRREEDCQEKTGNHIKSSLQYSSPPVERRVLKLDDRFTVENLHGKTRRLQCGRQIFIGDIVNLTVVEKLALLIVRQRRIAYYDFIDAFFLSDFFNEIYTGHFDLVDDSIPEHLILRQLSAQRCHLVVDTDQEHAVYTGSLVYQKPFLHTLNHVSRSNDIQYSERPSRQNNKARRKPFPLEEDGDNDEHQHQGRRLKDPKGLIPETARRSHGIESLDSINQNKNGRDYKHDQHEILQRDVVELGTKRENLRDISDCVGAERSQHDHDHIDWHLNGTEEYFRSFHIQTAFRVSA